MIQMSKGTREPWEKNPFPSGWYSYYTRDGNKRISEKEYEEHKSHVKKVSNNVEVTLKNKKGQDYTTHLFVKSHLFADSLGGRSFRNNVITGTQMQNVGTHKGGMQYIEKKYYHMLKNPKIHVFYSVTPEYTDTELIPRSVLVSALSSDGKIDESVRVSNSAEGFDIDYQHGGLISNTNTNEVTNEDENQPVEHPQEDEELDDAA